MQRAANDIAHHVALIDPLDYQVDDVLLCVQTRDGLQRGGFYVAHEVTRRKVGTEVVTSVTLEKNGQLIAVAHAELFLARTQLLVDLVMPDGAAITHSFPSLEAYRAWCIFFGVPPEAIHRTRLARAQPVPGNARFAAMCVPDDDGGGPVWYVHDLVLHTSEPVPAGGSSHILAMKLACESNRAWRAAEEVAHG